VPAERAPATGELVGIGVRRDRIHLFDAATGAAIAPTNSPW
jgi:hypothetical protein